MPEQRNESSAATTEYGTMRTTLARAASPLSRVTWTHSPACPLMHGGSCACGVADIEELTKLAAVVRDEEADALADLSYDRETISGG
jgi:hypothetical protein